jgi:alkaline phosphatase
MMKKNSLITLALLAISSVAAAQYKMHAHNDYEHPIPFLTAYYRGFGSIEADVYERNGQLFVSHEEKYIDASRTLEALYLKPLLKKKTTDTLQLMIDFKTPGEPTMKALVNILKRYPQITSNPSIVITISGEQPAPALWAQYPSFIHFDGKRYEQYTKAQAARIPMYSADIKLFTNWNGKGIIVKPERDNLQHWIDSVHAIGKKVRLWGVADNVNSWKTQMSMGADYIGTDQLEALSDFLSNRHNMEYKGSAATHELYKARYVNNDSLTTVNNVILLIGDGTGLTQIYSGFTGNRGKLNLLQMINIGFSKTYSADSYITDSAAGGTAMASGHKTNNRYVGVDATGVKIPAIPDVVPVKTGLISSGDITDATPAAFYAHVKDRSEEDAIARDFLNSPVQVMIGGGAQHFTSIVSSLNEKGYSFHTQFEDIDTIASKKFLLLSKTAELSMLKGRGDFLTRSLDKTIKTLGDHFFIMAEGAQVDYGGHANVVPYVVTEMMDFDKAVGAAMKFADEDGHTLVIVTADHETGGLSLIDGDISKGYVEGHFSTNDHTAVMVPVFAYGPHSLDFRGVYENTEIFEKIVRLLKK